MSIHNALVSLTRLSNVVFFEDGSISVYVLQTKQPFLSLSSTSVVVSHWNKDWNRDLVVLCVENISLVIVKTSSLYV